jgi:hypothetical protein
MNNNSSKDLRPPKRRSKPTPQSGSVLPRKRRNPVPFTAPFSGWNKS